MEFRGFYLEAIANTEKYGLIVEEFFFFAFAYDVYAPNNVSVVLIRNLYNVYFEILSWIYPKVLP